MEPDKKPIWEWNWKQLAVPVALSLALVGVASVFVVPTVVDNGEIGIIYDRSTGEVDRVETAGIYTYDPLTKRMETVEATTVQHNKIRARTSSGAPVTVEYRVTVVTHPDRVERLVQQYGSTERAATLNAACARQNMRERISTHTVSNITEDLPTLYKNIKPCNDSVEHGITVEVLRVGIYTVPYNDELNDSDRTPDSPKSEDIPV